MTELEVHGDAAADRDSTASTAPPAIVFDGVEVMDPTGDWNAPFSLVVPEGWFYVVRTSPARSAPLVRLCAGLLAPARGRVEVLGQEPWKLTRVESQRFRGAVGVGLFPHGLISNLTLRMNIVVPLVYGGAAQMAEAMARAEQVMDECGLSAWADVRPAEAPTDARQKAVIARALARSPRLLVMQDPLYAVHDQETSALLMLCRRYAQTALIVTHRADAALYSVADVVATWDAQGFRAHRAHRGSITTPKVRK